MINKGGNPALVNNGDIVFFKKSRRTLERKGMELTFKGFGFGLFLGAVAPFGEEPTAVDLFRILGTIGLLKFDDIAEFFGNEIGAECIKKFEDKYYGKKIEIHPTSVPKNGEDATTTTEEPKEETAKPIEGSN